MTEKIAGAAHRSEDTHALRTRVCALEAALARVAGEVETALGTPDIAFLTLCRIGSIARRSVLTASAG
jgi:hypothetical protein